MNARAKAGCSNTVTTRSKRKTLDFGTMSGCIFSAQRATQPPSITIEWPVTNEDASESSQTTPSPISEGWPQRPTGSNATQDGTNDQCGAWAICRRKFMGTRSRGLQPSEVKLSPSGHGIFRRMSGRISSAPARGWRRTPACQQPDQIRRRNVGRKSRLE
jgi:hypothetical protein